MASFGERRIAVRRRSTVHVASERNGQAEQAVLEGLTFAQPDRRFVGRDRRLNVDDAARRADVAGDIRTGWLAGSKSHRHGLRCGLEFVTLHLQHRASRKANAVLARQLGNEAARVSVVRPMSRPKQRELHRRIVFQLIELFAVDGLVVLGEEHRLAFAEGGSFGEEARCDGSKLGDWLGFGTVGHRLSQRGIGGIEIGRQLHAGHVERFRSLIETMPFTVFGKHVPNIQLRQLENVAQVLLVLIAIEPPQWTATMSLDVSKVCTLDCPRELLHQFDAPHLRKVFRLRRHLAFLDAIMDAHPTFPHRSVTQFKRQRRDIQPTFSGLFVVTFEARLFEHQRSRWW